jgi:hypothetical protein
MVDPKIGFIGMIHSSLDKSRLDDDFGKSIATLNTSAAIGDPKPAQNGLAGVIARYFWLVLSMRISRGYKNSTLFNRAGAPVVPVNILTSEELARLKNLSL